MTDALPRLAVISDVAPEKSVAGKLLVFRLLREYDASKLRIVEGDVWPTDPAKRLPAVAYETMRYKHKYQDTRLHPLVGLLNIRSVARHVGDLRKIVEEHKADAILTVVHGHLWLAAARVARDCGLPLHVMIHDDWAGHAPVPKPFRPLLHRQFKKVYTQASSRFCVSESMEAEYRKRYGVGGTVLLPFRGPDSPPSRVRMRQRRASDPLHVAFAGSIANADYWRLLRELATALNVVGGRLDLYSDVTREAIAREGLDRPEVKFHGLLPPTELAERLGGSADVLFAPASFAPADADYMRTCFPSKLVEYTAIGIPILIWGPEYSAAVQWGRTSRGAAEVVSNPAPEAIAESLRRLMHEPERAHKMAETALELGNMQFSFERARIVFERGLVQ